MKCVLCHERKGKRACKLMSTQVICPPCCASTRRDECVGCDYHEPWAYRHTKQARNERFIAEIHPDVDDQCDEALTLVEQGNIAKAEAMLEGLRQRYPNYHSVLYGTGVCHAIKGQTDEAIVCFERAVEIFPVLAHAHYNLGTAYCQKLNVENAVKSFQATIEIDGEEGSVGRLARKRIADLEAAVRSNGISLNTYISNQRIFNRAFAALREKRFQAAIDLFEQILATEEGHVQSYGNMGLAYAGLGNKQKALECLDKAIALDPEYELAIVNRVVVASLEDGETVPDVGEHDVDYYREFKDSGRSYVQEVVKKLGTLKGLKSADTA